MKRPNPTAAIPCAALLLFALGVAFAGPLPADEAKKGLFTWVDDAGVRHYSDTPDHPRARRLALSSRPTDLERVLAERQDLAAERAARDQARAEDARATERAAQEEQARERRCERARARLRTLSVARRPFRVDENGQQLFLTEGQIAEERNAAERAVSEHCN